MRNIVVHRHWQSLQHDDLLLGMLCCARRWTRCTSVPIAPPLRPLVRGSICLTM